VSCAAEGRPGVPNGSPAGIPAGAILTLDGIFQQGIQMSLAETSLAISSENTTGPTGRYFVLSPCVSISDIKAVIAGHSHSAAISRALVAKATTAVQLEARHIALALGIGGLRGGPGTTAYWDILENLARTRSIAIVWNGNQHNADFLLTSGQPLDFVPRGYPDPSVLPKTRLVAEAAIREHIRPSLDPLRQLLAKMPAHNGLKRLLVGTPAPLFDNDEIRRRLGREPLFREKVAAMGLDIGQVEITPPTVLRKLWFVIQTMMAEIAEEGGWQFVPVAPETMDGRGYLRLDLSADDVTHANIEFGSMMVRQIATFLKS
jgi:hypothetical protein